MVCCRQTLVLRVTQTGTSCFSLDIDWNAGTTVCWILCYARINMKLCWIWICILLFSTTACSVVGKRLYYEPQVNEKWIHLKRSANPIAEYRCSDAVLQLYSSQVGEIVYTIGPPLIPIFPTFTMLDFPPGEKGFEILVVTDGTMTSPNLQQDSITLSFGEPAVPLVAKKILHTDCYQFSTDGHWRCHYYFSFQKSLATYESFTAVINQRFNDCTIPSILYTKKDDSFFYPFIFPLPAEHRH